VRSDTTRTQKERLAGELSQRHRLELCKRMHAGQRENHFGSGKLLQSKA
jgi:hypothetical protein